MIEREAISAGLVRCPYCDKGFRRAAGAVHVGSQRKGMIPDHPCERVFAVHIGNATELNAKPYLGYVDGEPLKNGLGVPRRFASAKAAYRAACNEAPQRDHDGAGAAHISRKGE